MCVLDFSEIHRELSTLKEEEQPASPTSGEFSVLLT